MPPQAPQGAQGGNVSSGSSLSSSVTRTMPEDLRRAGAPLSASGSGKILWPSGTGPDAPLPGALPSSPKGGFLSSLLQSKHKSEAQSLPPVASTSQKIPVQGEESVGGSVWDSRVPSTPLSALPIPQKPIVHPSAPAVPPKPVVAVVEKKPEPVRPVAQSLAMPPSFTPVPTPVPPPLPPVPVSIPRPTVSLTPVPPRPPQVSPTIPASIPKAPLSIGQVVQSPPKPVAPPPAPRPPLPTPIQPPRPMPPPVSRPMRADEDVGIDLGISDYLKGGPTFQIGHGEAPIPKQSVLRPLASTVPPMTQTPSPLGGAWNPPLPTASTSTSIFAPSPSVTPRVASIPPAQVPQTAVAQYVSPKPTQSNADLDVEKDRLEGERAQIAGAKSGVQSTLQSLIQEKQQVENQIKPLLLREGQLAGEVEELEKKEQGLAGEVRRTIERDRWVKVEERRKVEQERILIKRRQVSIEGELHAKEEEQVSLVRREKDIDARILWIGGEYKRREVRMKLAGVNQEKTTIESHRAILDNGLKRLRVSLEETERNERRLSETKRSLAIKMPQNITEEERFAIERFDIEKQIHDMETRRWSLEDELKTATELFAKEDMAYLDVMHRAEALEGELKALG